MRYGFTTGSCAAAAAKAAAYMLLTGREKHEITITTPKGILYHARMEEIISAIFSDSAAHGMLRALRCQKRWRR